MKKIILLLLLILCLCAPADAVNFVEIGRDDNYLVYLDLDSIELRKAYSDEYVVAWIKYIYRGDIAKNLSKEYKKDVGYLMAFEAYNKDYKQSQTLSETLYDKKGFAIVNDSQTFQKSKYEEIIPHTYGDLSYDLVMLYYNRK